jgi:hypothetical protein
MIAQPAMVNHRISDFPYGVRDGDDLCREPKLGLGLSMLKAFETIVRLVEKDVHLVETGVRLVETGIRPTYLVANTLQNLNG